MYKKPSFNFAPFSRYNVKVLTPQAKKAQKKNWQTWERLGAWARQGPAWLSVYSKCKLQLDKFYARQMSISETVQTAEGRRKEEEEEAEEK